MTDTERIEAIKVLHEIVKSVEYTQDARNAAHRTIMMYLEQLGG